GGAGDGVRAGVSRLVPSALRAPRGPAHPRVAAAAPHARSHLELPVSSRRRPRQHRAARPALAAAAARAWRALLRPPARGTARTAPPPPPRLPSRPAARPPAAQPTPASALVLAPRSDPNRDRPRRPRSPRAPARPLTAALAALAQTLRAPRAASAPAASPGERLAATQTRDRPRGRYVGTPPNGPNAGPASTPRAALHHPWRTTFSARQRRLNATKPG